MTLTPCDFSMLTGLRVRVGGPIPFDLDMAQWRAAQLQLLGAIPDINRQGMVRYSWFYDHFIDIQPATVDEIAQYARGFLMYLLSTTLFANRENTVGIYLLGALVHLPRLAEYDWGGASLATLYCCMSSVSCRKTDLFDGYWRVWEVYTYFTTLAPVLVRPIELSVPRSRYYNSRFRRRHLVDRTYLYFRRFFDTITADQVDWHPWAGISPASRATYAATWYASTMRILFEGPFGRAYYLGERFIRQTRGVAHSDVSHPPPPGMKTVDEIHD
ncbi:protein MAINTENANCE OF MERISTEMS-like [Camellia sinensis]|uniref:protein MAINTENANCE OF MERISTEMS-like n=1 Tax=Camellia sinensis TaxID=4442 RepID=UPI00103587C0|nr:protein MAINTENANCE OF MERISTEMS-like [Camellia sinensis]